MGTKEAREFFNATMMELGVLGGLILIMVISIFLLRYTRRFDPSGAETNVSADGRNR
jgi:hypothetical protein